MAPWRGSAGGEPVLGVERVEQQLRGARGRPGRPDLKAARAALRSAVGVQRDKGVGRVAGRDGRREQIHRDPHAFEQRGGAPGDVEVDHGLVVAAGRRADRELEMRQLVGQLGDPVPGLDAHTDRLAAGGGRQRRRGEHRRGGGYKRKCGRRHSSGRSVGRP